MKIKDLNRHEEVADLLFRIAAIIGAQGYLVRRKTTDYIDLELIEEARDESGDPFRSLSYGEHSLREGSRAEITAPKEIAHYNEAHGVFQEPPEELAPFDPSAVVGDKSLSAIKEFSPGSRVELHTAQYDGKANLSPKAKERRDLSVLFFILGVALVLVGLWQLLGKQELITGSVIIAASIIPLLAPLLARAEAAKSDRESLRITEEYAGHTSLLFDWEARELLLQRPEADPQSVSFDDMECLTLLSSKQPSGVYTYRVVLLLPGDDVSLLYTTDNQWPHPDKDSPCVRFMIDLARSLSLPWRFA